MKETKGLNGLAFMQNGRKLPLNIQMFADPTDDGQGGQDGDGDVDYKAEYERMKADLEKAKAEKDKASKEASDFKKQLRAKESDEEAKARQEEEKKQEYENMIAENKRMRLERDLSKGNVFTSEEIEKLCEARITEDNGEFAKTLNELIKLKLETQKNELLKEYKKGFKMPSGSSNEDEIDEDVQALIDKSKSSSTDKARERFLKR